MAAHTNRTAVNKAITDIQRFYESGRKSLEPYPNALPHGKWVKLTVDAKMNRDRYLKCRQFARTVSKPDLKRICREIEHGGFPVGVQHAIRLLRLPENQRWRFLQKIIAARWSCRQLTAAIQQRTRRRPIGGRKPQINSQSDAVQKLLRICEQWSRLHGVIMGKKNVDQAVGMELSPAVRNELGRCDAAVNQLYKRLLKTP